MNWWQKPARRMHVIFLGSLYENDVDVEEYVHLLKKLHVNESWFAASIVVDGLGEKVSFNSVDFEKMPGLDERDFFEAYVLECRRQDIRPMAYLNVHWFSKEFGEKHEDWEQLLAEGRPVREEKMLYGSEGTSFCVNTPWRDWSYHLIKEVAQYDIDGVFLDGPVFFSGCCYCAFCRSKFKEQVNADLPEREDWSNPTWRDFVEFRSRSIVEYIADAKAALKSVIPEAILYMNAETIRSPGCGRDTERLAVDINSAEAFYTGLVNDRLLLYPAATAKYLTSMEKPAEVILNTWRSPWSTLSNSSTELKLRIAQTAANDASPMMELYDDCLKHDPSALEAIEEMYEFLEEHEKYYENTRSVANVALLNSRQSRLFYVSAFRELYQDTGTGKEQNLRMDLGTGKSEVDWQVRKRMSFGHALNEYEGFCEALMRTHIPFDIIGDTHLTPGGLSKYDVIVLPNAACLSDAQIEVLKAFVKDGGGIVATFETSLYDERGNPREEFGLSELFKVGFPDVVLGPSGFDFMVVEAQHPVTKGFDVGQHLARPISVLGVSSRKDAAVLIRALEPLRHPISALKLKTNYPALIAAEYGKGRVIYMPGLIGGIYLTHKMTAHQNLMENAVRWILGDRSLVEVEAPETVEVEIRTQTNPDRTLLHLVNLTGEMRRPMEHVIPIHDIKIRLRATVPSRIFSLTTERAIDFKQSGAWIELVVPRLDLYDVLVIE